MSRLSPVRALSGLVARAAAGVEASIEVPWEELAVRMAATVVRLASGLPHDRPRTPPSVVARVMSSVRAIERNPGARLTLQQLATDANLSPFHYLRTFQRLTGVTPHQFILRARLREAATRLVREKARVIDIGLESGFGDISNFNRSFRAEFGVAPETYRRQAGTRGD